MADFYRYFFLCVAVLVIPCGVVLLFEFAHNLFKAIASRSWPSTVGVILSSTLNTFIPAEPKIATPEIIYQYVVDGIHRQGNIVTFRVFLDIEGEKDIFGAFENRGVNYLHEVSQDIVKRYPEGKSVAVFYNPRDPSEAVLEPGGVRSNVSRVLALICAIVGGVIVILFLV